MVFNATFNNISVILSNFFGVSTKMTRSIHWYLFGEATK